MIDYSYLAPPSKVNRIKIPNTYIYEFVSGKHVRRIFSRCAYNPFQKQAVYKLKDYLKTKRPSLHYPDELLLRFSYLSNFMISDAAEKAILYDEWHQNQSITSLHKPGRQILQNGHIYTYGRDYQYGPILIVRAQQFDLKKYSLSDYLNAICNLLNPIQRYMLVDGVIEKWSVLVDFQGRKIYVNVQLLCRRLKKIYNAYPFRLKRLMFINTHQQTLSYISHIQNFVKGIDSQIQINIFNNIQQIDSFIATDQRQKKYGGSLSNLCEYWPIHTTNKYEQTQSQIQSQTEYESAMNDPIFFQENRAPLCDFSANCIIY